MKNRKTSKAKKQKRKLKNVSTNSKDSALQTEELGLPLDLYAGIAGTDPETLAQARADRQRGFLAELRDKKREVLQAGNSMEAEKIGQRIIKLRQHFQRAP